MGTIEERLAKLEATARRWRLAALGLAGVVVLTVGMGAAEIPLQKIIRTNLLVIEDDNGEIRATFGFVKVNDIPTLAIRGRDEKSRTIIQGGVEAIKVVTAEEKSVFIQ